MKDKNFWIWGHHSVEACLECAPDSVLELVYESHGGKNPPGFEHLENLAKQAGLKFKKVPELPRVLKEHRTQGVAMLLGRYPYKELPDLRDDLENLTDDRQQWAILDGVEDPRNFGSVLRSAAAFGLKGVIVGRKYQAPMTGVVTQASAGQCFRVPVYEVGNLSEALEAFHDKDFTSLGLDGASTQSIETPAILRKVWVLGSEGKGLGQLLSSRLKERVKIPMYPGVESLNASVAAAIAFYGSAFKN